MLSMSGNGDAGAAAEALPTAESARFCNSELRLIPAGRVAWETLERNAAAVALGSRGLNDVWGFTPAYRQFESLACCERQ